MHEYKNHHSYDQVQGQLIKVKVTLQGLGVKVKKNRTFKNCEAHTLIKGPKNPK